MQIGHIPMECKKELRITRNHQENLEGITLKKEIDIGKDPILEIDPILEEGMMKTDMEGDVKIDIIGLIQEKDLIDIKQNTELTLEADIKGMTDTEEMTGTKMMIDTEEMIILIKRVRYFVTSKNHGPSSIRGMLWLHVYTKYREKHRSESAAR